MHTCNFLRWICNVTLARWVSQVLWALLENYIKTLFIMCKKIWQSDRLDARNVTLKSILFKQNPYAHDTMLAPALHCNSSFSYCLFLFMNTIIYINLGPKGSSCAYYWPETWKNTGGTFLWEEGALRHDVCTHVQHMYRIAGKIGGTKFWWMSKKYCFGEYNFGISALAAHVLRSAFILAR